jgi:predicted HD superfamily hydrolase involved in NAD metabolism
MSPRLPARIAARLESLPEGLRLHIHRVRDIAVELARRHHVNEEQTTLGALAHDLARAMKGEQLLAQARTLGLSVHPVEESFPLLLHGPVAAELLWREDGLEDREVYDAVYWHSTARSGLGPSAKVVFLADKLDPHKACRYPYLPELRELAMVNLDSALVEFLSREMVSLLQHGDLVHPASLEARNAALMALRREPG